MEKTLKINAIPDRQFILSPMVRIAKDTESKNNDFYQISSQFVQVGKLGFGTLVSHQTTGSSYIIINMRKDKIAKFNLKEKINSTLELMYSVNIPFLFRLLSHYEEENYLFLIMESITGGTFDSIISSRPGVSFLLNKFKQVCIGVKFLHNKNIFNISLTPENILYDEKTQKIKLTDYDIKLSSKKQKIMPRKVHFFRFGKSEIGITAYTSPEELSAIKRKTRPNVNKKTDSWRLGILLYEMLSDFGECFIANDIDEMIIKINSADCDLSCIKDEFILSLLKKLICPDPHKRLEVEEILKLPEIQAIDVGELRVDRNDMIINDVENRDETINYEENLENDINSSMLQSLQYENNFLKKKIELLEGTMSHGEDDIGEDYRATLKNMNSSNILSVSNESLSQPIAGGETLFNTLKLVKSSQKSFNSLIEKLISLSKKESGLLLDQSKNFIEDQKKMVLDCLNDMKEELNEKEKFMKDAMVEQNEWTQKLINELAQLKSAPEVKKENDEGLKKQLELYKEIIDTNQEVIETMKKNFKEQQDNYRKLEKEKEDIEKKLSEAKNFFLINCDDNLCEKFFKLISD